MPINNPFVLGNDSVDTANIVDAAVTNVKLGTDTFKWELLETLSPSSASSVTSGTLSASEYMIVYYLEMTGTSSGGIYVRINGDTGSNYDTLIIQNTTVAVTASNSNGLLLLFSSETTNRPRNHISGQILVPGTTPAVASGRANIAISTSTFPTQEIGLAGAWIGGNNTSITSFTFRNTGAGNGFTGTIYIYGR